MSPQLFIVRQIMVRLQYEVMPCRARQTEWFTALWKLWCDSLGRIRGKPFFKNVIRCKCLQVIHSESNITFCGFQQVCMIKIEKKLVIKNICEAIVQFLYRLLISNKLLIFLLAYTQMDSTWCIRLPFCSSVGETPFGCFDPSAV